MTALRKGVGLLVLLLILLGAVLLMQHCSETPDRPRTLREEELRALPEDQLESRIIADLSQRMYFNGYTPDAWRRISEPAANLWAVCSIEESISGYGFARILDMSDGSGDPNLQDAIKAYTAMGLTGPAKELIQAQLYIEAHRTPQRSDAEPAGTPSGAGTSPVLSSSTALRDIRRSYLATLGQPSVSSKRLAYLKTNLSILSAP